MTRPLNEIINQLDEGIRRADSELDAGTKNAWLELVQWCHDQGIQVTGTVEKG